MEAEEADSWYDTQKQKLFEQYLEQREKNKTLAEETYKQNVQKIRKRYETMIEKCMKESILKNQKMKNMESKKLFEKRK
jgi:hypothetical protein